MNRYFSSFLMTTILYSIIVIGIIYSSNTKQIINSKVQKSEQAVKFTVIKEYKQKVIVKPIIKPKPKKIIQTKPKLKPVTKPKPKVKPKHKPIIKPKLKKIIQTKPKLKPVTKPKPKIEQVPIIQKKQEPKQILQKIEKQFTKTILIKKNNSLIKKALPTIDLKKMKMKQNLFYKKIRTTINKNKSYPRKAIRRGIEGNIKISFILLSSGIVKDIKVISGKNIFKKSAINSIQKSFPMEIDDKLFIFPKLFTIKLNFKLN